MSLNHDNHHIKCLFLATLNIMIVRFIYFKSLTCLKMATVFCDRNVVLYYFLFLKCFINHVIDIFIYILAYIVHH